MSFYEFATNSPWLTFFLAIVVLFAVELPFKIVNRFFRHLNIRKAGWPPAHCDADGDLVEKD